MRRTLFASVGFLALLLLLLPSSGVRAELPAEPPEESAEEPASDEPASDEGDEEEGDEAEGDEEEGDDEGDEEEGRDLHEESEGELPKCDRPDGSEPAEDPDAEKKDAKPDEKKEATPEDLVRAELVSAVDRYADAARDFQEEMHALIKKDVDGQRKFIDRTYGKKIGDIESSERLRRLEAIKRFQRFIQEYPNDPKYTPDAMFRLAELYFEFSAVRFNDALDQFSKDTNLYERGKIPSEPQQPERDFSDCVRLYKTLIARFGESYRYADAVYYLLGYVQNEQANDEEALDAWYKLVKRFPKSDYAPEAWLRVGEIHFEAGEFKEASDAYLAVGAFPNSSYYDKSLYKLGWTYFQLYEYDIAIKTFQKLIAWYDRTGKSGDVTASALRQEAIDYLAMSLVEEDWNNDGLTDPDAGVERGLGYLADGSTYETEVVTRYAKALWDLNDRKFWGQAIEVYRYLVKKRPLSPEAAEHQTNIIKLYDEMSEIDAASKERKLLAENFGPGTDWWSANEGNPGALRKMRKAVEAAMSQRAVYHHQRAQELKFQAKSQDKPELLVAARSEYEKAAKAYEDYLDTYPHEPIVYEMTFYLAETLWYSGQFVRAAPIYHRIATDPKKSEYRETAALSSVQAREKIVQQLAADGEIPAKLVPGSEWETDEEEESEEGGEEETETASAASSPLIEEPIPDAVQAWIDAADHYMEAGFGQKGGDEEALSVLAYQVAETYLRVNRLDDARERFKKVISCHPKSEVAAFAIANIINSYRAQNDFPNLEKWANLAEQLELGDPELQAAIRREIKVFKLGAQFKHAETLYKEEKWLDAAREFERLARANMDASFADKAFYNAADAFKRARYYDSAATLFEILVTDDRYKDSSFAEDSLFELAEANKQFFSFEKSTAAYQALFTRYPEGKNRRYALFQSARLQEAAGDYRRAAKTYEQYTQMFPDREESAGLLFLIGELYEKIGDVREQERIWKLFTKTQVNNAKLNQFYIRALQKLAHINRARRRGIKPAEKIEVQILAEYAARGLNPGTPAAKAAGEARFHQVEKGFERYKRLRMKSANQKKATKVIEQKMAQLKALEEEYASILAYKDTDWTIAVALRMADLYKEFAETLYKAPEPAGLSEEEYDMYVTMIEDLGLKFENIAIKRYETAVQQSSRLKVTNDWAMKARQAINKYKPEEYPLFKEERRQTVSDPFYTIDTRTPEGR